MLAQGVRTKTVKRAARVIIEKYYPRMTLDFQTNKRVCEEVAMIPTKALKNKIAGYATVSFCTRPANLHSPRAGASLLLRCRAHHIVLPLRCVPLRFVPLRLDARRARLSTDRALPLPPFVTAAPDEAHPAGPGARHLAQASGGGARAPHGLRA